MSKRRFSRETYNGYHLVTITGDDSPVGFFKKSREKDEFGNLAVEGDYPQCPHPGRGRFTPWDNWLYVPTDCQSCPWVYRIPTGSDYDCLLKTRQKVNPACLVNGDKYG